MLNSFFISNTIPPLSSWSLTPGYYRHSVQGKVERRIYFSVTPHFTAHLLLQSSLMTNSSLTHHIFPPPLVLATSVLHYFDQRAIDYISDINGCATKTHKCSNEKVICLNSIGWFECICKHGFSGDIHKCIGLTSSKNTRFIILIIMCSDYNT